MKSLATLKSYKPSREEKIRAARLLEVVDSTGAVMRLDTFRESMGPDYFDALLGDFMNKRVVDGYKIWDVNWEHIVRVRKNVSMLTQHAIRIDEFQNLDDLDETGGVFNEVTPLTDTDISWSVSGWGNLIALDFKTKQSDHLGWFGKMSERAGNAGKRTFIKWLTYTNLQLNPTVDDGNSLFDNTNHTNDCDAAGAGKSLNYENLHTANDKLGAQTDSNGEPLFVEGRWIICGPTNRAPAQTLVTSEFNPDSANNEPNYFKGILKGVVVSPYLGNDWYLSADASEFETFEVGFLDDAQNPQIFMLDPSVSDEYFKTKKFMWRVEQYFGGSWVLFGPASKQFEVENLVNCLESPDVRKNIELISRQARQECLEASETYSIPSGPDDEGTFNQLSASWLN